LLPVESEDRTATASPAPPRLWLLVLAAAALWLAGLAAGGLGYAAPAVALRWAGIALTLPYVLRHSSLTLWTFWAMAAGAQLGVDARHLAAQTYFLGELFLRLIRMLLAPLLFATLATGIAAQKELRSVGRIALKALLYFEIVTTIGLILGALAMGLSRAGWGISLPAQAAAPVAHLTKTWQQMVVELVPENLAQAVAQNQILEIVIFSLLFGAALAMLPEAKRAPLLAVLQSLADTMFQLTKIVMYLAPVAAGAALAYAVSSMGLSTLLALGKLVAAYYATLAIFCLLVLLPILLLFRIPVRAFVAAVGEPAAIGFATTSSEAALPLAMERMEEFGVPRWIVSFVIPIGYSFNMLGSSVYLSMAAVFTAQAAGIHLSLGQEIAMLGILMLASKGIAGIPRAVLVILMATASVIHVPTAPILLLVGIDTVMDMGRTMLNVVGNCMASAVIARSEGTQLLSPGA
jgi:proton glutamate symport protein